MHPHATTFNRRTIINLIQVRRNGIRPSLIINRFDFKINPPNKKVLKKFSIIDLGR